MRIDSVRVIVRCGQTMRYWRKAELRGSTTQRMLDPSSYPCSRQSLAKHSRSDFEP